MPISRMIAIALLGAALTVGAGAQDRGSGDAAAADPQDPNKPPPITRAVLGERAPELWAGGWMNYEGRPTLDSFKNRVVVLFFFRATDSSVDVLPQMTALQKKLSNAGVVFIGLSPQKRDQIESKVKDKEKDIKVIVGHDIDPDDRYQVSEYPRVMLIDTDGRLVSRFHPKDDLEGRIRAQLERTPAPDAKTLAARLDRAKEAAKEKNFGRAYTAARDVARFAGDTTTTGKAAADLMKKYEGEARKQLELAKKTVQAGETEKAADMLANLSVRFSGGALGADADSELGRLMGDVTAKKVVRAALQNAKGLLSNDLALAHERGGRFSAALGVYREVLEQYPDTEAAKEAQKNIDRINADPQIQQTVAAQWSDDEARRWLDLGDRYARVEMYGEARQMYEKLIDKHADSKPAKTAKERLAKLPPEEPETEEATPEEDSES